MSDELIFTGDLGLTQHFADTVEVFDKAVLDTFSSADGLCLSLELPFCTPELKMAPYTHPSLYSPVEKSELLRVLNPSVVNIGTNHCMDAGLAGIELTRNTLTDMGYTVVGAGVDDTQARRPGFIQMNNQTYGFLSYCKKGSFSASSTKPGAALLSRENLEVDIPSAAERCDHLTVLLHMGMEFSKTVHPSDRMIARYAIELGASCVIGHHPHVVQGGEQYLGKPVLYSLGNLVFDNYAGAVTFKGHWENRHRGLIARVSYGENSVKAEIIPTVYTSRPLRITLADGSELERLLGEFGELSNGIEEGQEETAAEVEGIQAIATREIKTVIALTRIHGFRFLWHFFSGLRLRHFRMVFRALLNRIGGK